MTLPGIVMKMEKMMSDLTPQGQLYELVHKIEAAVAEAEALANEHGLVIELDIAYGMGGTYYPPALLQGEESWVVDAYYLDADTGGWVASSQTC